MVWGLGTRLHAGSTLLTTLVLTDSNKPYQPLQTDVGSTGSEVLSASVPGTRGMGPGNETTRRLSSSYNSCFDRLK